ncbi:MAG: helix-turn-helix domain-containing protein [bacterium]
MQCEMCGKDFDSLHKALVEGVEMEICNGCLPMGKKIIAKKAPKPTGPKIEKRVVSHAGKLIKEAREKKGMRQVDFAKMLQIKDSYLHHVETEHQPIDVKLAEKIEDALGITLVKKYKRESSYVADDKEDDSGVTIADFIKKK